MKQFNFISEAEEGEKGFFDAQVVEAESLKKAYEELKLRLSHDEFETAEEI